MTANLDTWYGRTGNQTDVAVFTRCDIARNISGFMFPISMSQADSIETLSLVTSFFDTLPDAAYFKKITLDTIDALTVKLLEERGISFQHLPVEPKKALVVHDNGALYTGINMEDHINISSFIAGFDTSMAFAPASTLESKMQKQFLFSSIEDAGYITSDITGIGSGIKFSVLCSLPGILFSNSLASIIESVKGSCLNISGYYTFNSKESIGSLFALSTSVCAGGDEHSQLTEFTSAVQKIINEEYILQKKFAEENNLKVRDMIYRAFAISQGAKLMEFREAADIIFKIKLGLNLNIIKGITHEQCNAMLFKIQMGHIAFLLLNSVNIYDMPITESSIEECRANIIKDVCSHIKIVS